VRSCLSLCVPLCLSLPLRVSVSASASLIVCVCLCLCMCLFLCPCLCVRIPVSVPIVVPTSVLVSFVFFSVFLVYAPVQLHLYSQSDSLILWVFCTHTHSSSPIHTRLGGTRQRCLQRSCTTRTSDEVKEVTRRRSRCLASRKEMGYQGAGWLESVARRHDPFVADLFFTGRIRLLPPASTSFTPPPKPTRRVFQAQFPKIVYLKVLYK